MKLKRIKAIALPILIVLPFVLGGLFVPEYFLKAYSSSKEAVINSVPPESFTGEDSAVSSLASAQLSEYDRIRLISHSWGGVNTMVDANYSQNDEYSISMRAKKGLMELYKLGIFPASMNDPAGYNWYSWNAQRFCSTDTTFHSFRAYYWVVNLTRYDNSEKHTVLITEDGTVLYVRTKMNYDEKSVKNIATVGTKLPITNSLPCRYLAQDIKSVAIAAYPDVRYSGAKTAVGLLIVGNEQSTWEPNNTSIYSDNEVYYVFQNIKSNSDTLYEFGIVPGK